MQEKNDGTGASGSITGTINTKETFRQNLPKQVRLLNSDLKAISSQWTEGNNFVIRDIAPGTYVVNIELTDGSQFSKLQKIDPADNLRVDFDIDPEPPETGFISYDLPVLVKSKRSGKSKYGSFLKDDLFRKSYAINIGYIGADQGFDDLKNIRTLKVGSLEENLPVVDFNSDNSWKVFVIDSELFDQKIVSCPPNSRVRLQLKKADGPPEVVHPLNVVLQTQNFKAEAILDLISNGRAKDAHHFMDSHEAEDLLSEKKRDCSSAAIGGYYLLKVGDLHLMHNWANNLANWFPFLADGAVIHAWQMISDNESDPDQVLKIATRLVQAVDRGVPVYTEGLRLLNDGLKQLSSYYRDQYEIINDALKVVSGYVDQADFSARVTTLNNFDTGFYGWQEFKYKYPGNDVDQYLRSFRSYYSENQMTAYTQ